MNPIQSTFDWCWQHGLLGPLCALFLIALHSFFRHIRHGVRLARKLRAFENEEYGSQLKRKSDPPCLNPDNGPDREQTGGGNLNAYRLDPDASSQPPHHTRP